MEVPGLRTGDAEVFSHLPELPPLVIGGAGASSVLSQTLSSHWAAPRGQGQTWSSLQALSALGCQFI